MPHITGIESAILTLHACNRHMECTSRTLSILQRLIMSVHLTWSISVRLNMLLVLNISHSGMEYTCGIEYLDMIEYAATQCWIYQIWLGCKTLNSCIACPRRCKGFSKSHHTQLIITIVCVVTVVCSWWPMELNTFVRSVCGTLFTKHERLTAGEHVVHHYQVTTQFHYDTGEYMYFIACMGRQNRKGNGSENISIKLLSTNHLLYKQPEVHVQLLYSCSLYSDSPIWLLTAEA